MIWKVVALYRVIISYQADASAYFGATTTEVRGGIFIHKGEKMNKSYLAEQIKGRIKFPELLENYGIEVKRGNRIPCPFHNGKDLNCGVKSDYIHCFVCGESADQIGFVQKYFGLSFADSVTKINEDFSLGLDIEQNIDKRKQTEIAKQSFLRKKQQKQREEEKERLLNAWIDAQQEFVRLQENMKKYRPKQPCEQFHPLFSEAISNLEYAKYKMQCAEEEYDRYSRDC